ncbi:M24 family metallopeptidase [Mycolicibacter sp. MYC123]|uniref:M24 family metallopeptidase n=1 Tax=[Mycobacterium] zoologicum TaxID=2872311 RepID=A0ABU5YJD7_9MYCO|nr:MULTISPECIES: M24 family metallopeptidase [unclassified Mycolicibacter]MEB3049961.1 M24 family metallopeptidase [Mycolicibacter sp. MYC123]MEB3062327.1 M24 family metallopeptidase [Mycolicibacter sp. MYC101]
MSTPGEPESIRVERLLDAQARAVALFDEIERRGLVRPGVGERQLSDEIRDLAADMFGVTRHWHKRVIRAGENTLLPFHADPPDRVMADDDIAYLDLGPIFAEWEADFGRTFVLGDDPDKLALRDALPRVWQAGRAFFDAHADVTGAQLYEHVGLLAQAEGFEFGAPIAGHLLGEFPHKKISGDDARFYVAPGSDEPMRRTDPTGRICHWILEVHLTNRARGFGGFYEQLLDL